MKYRDYTWFVVYLCGPTDCFPVAVFQLEEKAKEWAVANQVGDGFLIKEMTLDELAELTDN
jgi:hypothetical protein